MLKGQQRACMPVYIGKSGDLVGCYRSLTDRQTTEYRATQLVQNIKLKLSHAIINCLIRSILFALAVRALLDARLLRGMNRGLICKVAELKI